MAKKDKAIPEEVLIKSAPAIIQQLAAGQSEETFEQRRERELREAFIERNAEAIAARREVLERNHLPDDTAGIDPDEARKRCCS